MEHRRSKFEFKRGVYIARAARYRSVHFIHSVRAHAAERKFGNGQLPSHLNLDFVFYNSVVFVHCDFVNLELYLKVGLKIMCIKCHYCLAKFCH